MASKSWIDFYKLANARFRQDPVWRKIMQSTSRVIDDLVETPRQDLATIRDPKRYHRGDIFPVEVEDGKKVEGVVNHVRQRPDGVDELYVQVPHRGVFTFEVNNRKDRSTLVNGAIMHGFNYFSDTLDNEDYQRIVEWVEYFWPNSSDDNFVRFIGFVKNLDLDMYQLWSQELFPDANAPPDAIENANSYPFLEEWNPSMLSVEQGGTFYPTSHVELQYNAVISDSPGGDIGHLFYLLAPIHLVLQRIAANIDAVINYSIIGIGDIMVVQSAVIRIED